MQSAVRESRVAVDVRHLINVIRCPSGGDPIAHRFVAIDIRERDVFILSGSFISFQHARLPTAPAWLLHRRNQSQGQDDAVCPVDRH